VTKESDKTSLLLADAARRGIAYRQSCGGRNVAPSPASLDAICKFVEPLPENGTSDDEILATNWLTTAWDQNVAMHEVTPAAATLEQVALDWLVDVLGLPHGTGGGFVTGATVANFTALAAARHRVFADAGWDVEADGLIGAPALTVIVGEEAHPTLFKSLGMLGLGRERVVRIPVDGQGRMIAAELPEIDGPTIVCTQAGNINTGAFDPIGEICGAVRPSGAWVHVDGAFGLWAAASPEQAHLIKGMQNADSWATDAHKWLNVPYDCGIAFVRNPPDLASAMAITADYLTTDTEHRNPSDYTPELSRRGRGIDVWAALRSLGRSGVAELVSRCCRHATRFAVRCHGLAGQNGNAHKR